MKWLYEEFYFVPKSGRIREKVMLTRLVTTLAVVIMCLMGMSITAYAYFAHDLSTASNIIRSAYFEAEVSINEGAVAVTKSGKVQTALLPAGGTYTVTLSKGESTAKTGFCVITFDGDQYHTAQIGADLAQNLTDAEVTFTLSTTKDTTLEILSSWGTCSAYTSEKSVLRYLVSGDSIGSENPPETPSQNTDPVTTVPPTTTAAPAPVTTTAKKVEQLPIPAVSDVKLDPSQEQKGADASEPAATEKSNS